MVCSSEGERVGRKVWWTVGKQVSKTILHTDLDWSELCQSGERGREILEIFRVGRNRGICLRLSFSRHVYGKQTRKQDYRLNAHKENWFYSRGLITTVGNNDLMRNLGTSQFLNTAEKRKKGTTSRLRRTLKGSWFRV